MTGVMPSFPDAMLADWRVCHTGALLSLCAIIQCLLISTSLSALSPVRLTALAVPLLNFYDLAPSLSLAITNFCVNCTLFTHFSRVVTKFKNPNSDRTYGMQQLPVSSPL